MKHALFALVMGLGLGVMGCATDVEDPVPPAPTPTDTQGISRATPNQALNAPFNDPHASLTTTQERINLPNKLPAWQVPVPGPAE